MNTAFQSVVSSRDGDVRANIEKAIRHIGFLSGYSPEEELVVPAPNTASPQVAALRHGATVTPIAQKPKS